MLQASEATVRADHHYRTPAVVYLCRGIVYCECGSKMHATVWRLKKGKKQIAEKQAAYDNLMKNMMSGVLAPEVIKEINDRMTAIKGEIETLENAEAPKDYTMETILEWLDSIKKAPDQRAVELLIKKITVSRENNKTDFKIESNLKSVCVEMVAGEGLEPTTSGL